MTPKTTPPSQSAKSPLHPVLKSALESLDIDLEMELKRYRRYRSGKPVPTVRSLGSYQSSSTPAIGISTATTAESLVVTGEDTAYQQSDRASQKSLAATTEEVSDASHTEAQSSAGDSTDVQENSDSERAPTSLEALSLPNSNLEKQEKDRHNHPGDGFDAGFASNEGFVTEDDSLGTEDYLSSSQELLRNLEPPESEGNSARKEPTKRADATPSRSSWGGVWLVLLLLAGGAIAYLWQNPQLAARLQVRRFFPNASQPSADSTADTGQSAKTPADARSVPPMELAPNLAKKEFVGLDLNTLSTVNPNPQTVPVPSASNQTASPNNQTSAAPTATSNPLPPKDGDNRLGNLPSALMGDPTAESEQPANAASPTEAEASEATPDSQTPSNPTGNTASFAGEVTVSGGDGYFYVVMPYDGPSSVERAREAIADAYVREFPIGKTIQLGAFDDIATAKEMVQRLSQQGIQTQVYQP
jgi:hypothetical protein